MQRSVLLATCTKCSGTARAGAGAWSGGGTWFLGTGVLGIGIGALDLGRWFGTGSVAWPGGGAWFLGTGALGIGMGALDLGLWPGAWVESQSLSMDQDTTVDLWGFGEQLLLPCTQGDSDCDWQLLAQLPLGALDQLIAEHWPLGGCPWPKFGRHGSIYLMETSHGDRGGMNPRPFAWFEKLEGRTSTPAPCAACPTATRMA